MGFRQISKDSIKEMQKARPKSNAELTEENKQLREQISSLKCEYDAALMELAELFAGGEDDG